MLITTTFCFELGSVSGGLLRELVMASRFQATRIRTSEFKKHGGAFDNDDLQRLRRTEEPPQVTLETDAGIAGPYLRFGRFPSWGFEAFTWNVAATDQPDVRLLNSVTAEGGFTAGSSADADYTYWQSETSLDAYKAAARIPVERLRTKRDPTFNEDVVDISLHPGRRTMFPLMWLHAAWRMWFGGAAFQFVSKERLLSFKEARHVEELESRAVFIELFDLPETAPHHENIAIAFRKWTGMDVIEEQASTLASGVSDPTFEIFEGSFDHGGVRRVVEWLDERGDLIRRSRAKTRRTIELDADGKIIHSTDDRAQ